MTIKIYTIFPNLFLRYLDELEPHMISGRVTYVCVPVQSGSPAILERMNRRVDLDRLSRVILRIHEVAPEVTLYTHFIVGFSGESDEDFESTLEMAQLFNSALFIRYGENANTSAASFQPKCSAQQVSQHLEKIRTLVDTGKLPESCTVLG